MLNLVLLVFAFVFAVLAAFGINTPRISFGWVAVSLYLLSIILGGLVK